MSTEKDIRRVSENIKITLDGYVPAESITTQLKKITEGFKKVELDRPCVVHDGIYKISADEREELIDSYDEAVDDGRFSKFVPASGAATRLFKFLKNYLNNDEKLLKNDSVDKFVENLPKLPFYNNLEICMDKEGLCLQNMIDSKEHAKIIDYLLYHDPLALANLPKALIPFHNYDGEIKTPFHEHIDDCKENLSDRNGNYKIHFTVNSDYERYFEKLANEFFDYAKNEKADISFSVQDKKTDVISLNSKGELVLDEYGRVMTRPAGHGALLSNLNSFDADLVFISNIDNIKPKHKRKEDILYKKTLGGLMVQLQSQVFECINMLENYNRSDFEVVTAAIFLASRFFYSLPEDFALMSTDKRADILLKELKKPIRICGVVENKGEVGGAPYWVKSDDGKVSAQIIEKAQIDLSDSSQLEVFKQSTHFNPVDMICSIKNHKGEPFDLTKFADVNSGMIVEKNYEGELIHSMELPGLWNGAMSNWLTLFVEQPSSTFAPVKSVNDLLNPSHQL